MKRIAISQKVINQPDRNERLDALDQAWMEVMQRAGLYPILVPNAGSYEYDLEAEQIDGVLLTGGNDFSEALYEDLGLSAIAVGDQSAPERDFTEMSLVRNAERLGLPVLGVCRGMQLLHLLSGNSLVRVDGHVRTVHTLRIMDRDMESFCPVKANSYHNYGVPLDKMSPNFVGLACCGNVVEAFRSIHLPHWGIMWHPERGDVVDESDIRLLQYIFGSER